MQVIHATKLTKYGIITLCTYWALAETTEVLTKYGISLRGDIVQNFSNWRKPRRTQR